jgi:hypothetical protein
MKALRFGGGFLSRWYTAASSGLSLFALASLG